MSNFTNERTNYRKRGPRVSFSDYLRNVNEPRNIVTESTPKVFDIEPRGESYLMKLNFRKLALKFRREQR